MISVDYYWFFIVLLFVTAFLFASVGHGGGSGYLALMAIFGFAPSMMKSSALLINVFVSFIAFYQYNKGGYLKWNLFLPFAITSIPASFIGAFVSVDALLYKRILGLLLIFPILRLLGLFGKDSDEIKKLRLSFALIIGAAIGLISGMIGIGGGIILSPIILMLHWGNMKQTAAVSALFIFVNSISGLIGLLLKGDTVDTIVYEWLIVALIGGFIGAYYGRKKFSNAILKRILAVVLIIASVKLLTLIK